jgi:bifunctional ADP-heptose synthase (sugar kinase/adenylyltransferase)
MKILVIGDSCEDVFRYGNVDRIAPEAPIPVIVPDKRNFKSRNGRKCSS